MIRGFVLGGGVGLVGWDGGRYHTVLYLGRGDVVLGGREGVGIVLYGVWYVLYGVMELCFSMPK